MSPLWSDRLLIALRPDAVAIIRRQRWAQHILKQTEVPCTEGVSNSLDETLRTLTAALEDPAWSRTSATIILSHHFVRYAVIPWADDVRGRRERQAVARLHFQKIYGQRAEDWDIRISPGGIGAAWLASATDPALVPELTRLCSQASISLYSVQPYLMSAANYCHRHLDGPHTWFAVAERDRMILGLLSHNDWCGVRGMAWRDSCLPDFIELLEREEIIHHSPTGNTVHVFAPELEDQALPAHTHWNIQRLPMAQIGEGPMSGALSMAWTGR